MEITGTTYSVSDYQNYKEHGDINYFEEVIDKLILDKYSDDPELKEYISSLPLDKKRMAILSLLGGDNNLWIKIKALTDKNINKMDHIKDIILMLREYVKVGEVEKKKFGEVMTDLNLAKHILSRIPDEDFKNPNKTFIDLSNGTGVFPLVVIYRLMKGLEEWEPDSEKRYKHIVENQIFTSEIQPKNVFLYLCLIDPYDEYNLNIYSGSSLDNGLRKHMKEVWKREYFDYSIGNPPFNQMVDMKFVKLSYEIADVVCFVHPSTWLIDEKGKQKAFLSTKELVKDHLDSIELFNGNKIFNIALFVPCVITYIDKNKKSIGIKCVDKINNVELIYDNINQINKYSNIDVYPKIKEKILKKSNIDSLLDHKNKIFGNFYVNISQIRGHVNLNSDKEMLLDDFYTIITKDEGVSDSPTKHIFFTFEAEKEAENFIKYLKSDFCRFSLSIYKNNSQLDRGELKSIPWLDFKEEIVESKIYSDFNIEVDEIDFIKSKIPNYYFNI